MRNCSRTVCNQCLWVLSSTVHDMFMWPIHEVRNLGPVHRMYMDPIHETLCLMNTLHSLECVQSVGSQRSLLDTYRAQSLNFFSSAPIQLCQVFRSQCLYLLRWSPFFVILLKFYLWHAALSKSKLLRVCTIPTVPSVPIGLLTFKSVVPISVTLY